MNTWTWLLIGYFVLNIVVGAYTMGRPKKARDAASPGVAAFTLLVLTLMYGLLTLALLAAVGVL